MTLADRLQIALAKAMVLTAIVAAFFVLEIDHKAPTENPPEASWTMKSVIGDSECSFDQNHPLSGLPNAIVTYGKDSAVVLSTDPRLVDIAFNETVNHLDPTAEVKAFCIKKG